MELSESELQILIIIHKQIKDKKLAYKINALILLANEFTYPEIEKVLLLDDRTIRRYRDLYLEKGIEGLLEINYKGRQPKLTDQQEEELVDHLEKNSIQLQSKYANTLKKHIMSISHLKEWLLPCTV